MEISVEELRPIRLEIALSLVNNTHPLAKKALEGIVQADPVIGEILKSYQ